MTDLKQRATSISLRMHMLACFLEVLSGSGSLVFRRVCLVSVLSVLLLAGSGCNGEHRPSPNASRFNGTWSIVKDRSTAIDPWRDLSIKIDASSSELTLERIWHGSYGATSTDSITVPINDASHRVSLSQWSDNRHIGVFVAADSTKTVSAAWLDDGRTLRVTNRLTVRSSQGLTRLRTHSEYRVAPDGDGLTVLELRSTRPRPIHYFFQRSDSS